MKVYKFGGASVKSADGVRNLRHIVDGEENLFIIVSAMGTLWRTSSPACRRAINRRGSTE